MRVWKLEAAQDESRHPSRWGYALAKSYEDALAMCRESSGLPINIVHEKHPDMRWPGVSGSRLCWN